MLLSIIVTLYNLEDYVEECLMSILLQSEPVNFEVIVIDDGSSDNSSDIAKFFCNKHVNFNYYYQINKGLASARNYGITLSKGDYVAFVDADDWISPLFVNKIYEHILKTNSDIIYFDRMFHDGKNKSVVSYPSYRGKLKNCPSILTNINLSACNKVYKKTLLNDVTFKVGVIYEDFPFVILALQKATDISKCEGALYIVRTRRLGSITNRLNDNEHDLLANIKFIESKIDNPAVYIEFMKFKSITLVGWNFKLIRNKAFHLINHDENKNIKYSHLIKKWDKIGYVFIKLELYKTLSFLLTLRKKIIR
ncbi:glycosyltransferase family 2 protein [Photobacterium andalusiense]|uniref:Putative glycosyltransferase EpsJ n=1 Tax=Photobacterium andalusiense TaxID=2204296 RepID=A0A1Y6MJJ2_9GAMM|nr:glycosyltransferase family 2 protein [Photobacterium andalusiense]SMY35968.1 putative glycosyltransferase EpsJ [Photobacterium andalusiense]